jgi:hypothetical protein
MNELRIWKVEFANRKSAGYEEPYASIVAARDVEEAQQIANLRPGFPLRTLPIGRTAAEEPYVILTAYNGS